MSLQQFAQRIIDRVSVVDVQDKANVAQPLVPSTVIYIVQHHNLERAHIGLAGRRHAFGHPPGEGIEGNDQSEFEFGRFPSFTVGEVT